MAGGAPAIQLIGAATTNTVNIVGTLTGSSTQAALEVASTAANVYIRGNVINAGANTAIYARRIWWGFTGFDGETQGILTWTFRTQSGNDRVLYRSDQFNAYPAQSDVKIGTVFGVNDELAGTYVSTPAPADVAAAVWDYARSAATTDGSMGARLKDAATVATTGAQIAGFEE